MCNRYKTYMFQHLTFRQARGDEQTMEGDGSFVEIHEQVLSGAAHPYNPWFQIYVERRWNQIFMEATRQPEFTALSKVIIYPRGFGEGKPSFDLDFYGSDTKAEHVTTDVDSFRHDLHWLVATEPYTSIGAENRRDPDFDNCGGVNYDKSKHG